MVNTLRTFLIAAAVVAVAGVAFAEPVPPPPTSKAPGKAATPALSQPEAKSPCPFDLDAQWLAPLKTSTAQTVRTKVPHPVNCEGAVVTGVTATGKGAQTTLQFAVAYKPGQDRAGFIEYAIVDDNRNLGVGEAVGTLVAGETSQLSGTFTIKSREFERAFASDKTPILRVTVRMGDHH
jgi:lipoprotein-anchoring transpeptidase ErfK/SrfK